MNSPTIPIILDTDIGSDIDDAVALAYLLRQKRCELVGITTVSGDVGQRAACAQVICEAAGRSDIPIHAGASDVLLVGPGQPNVPQYQAIAHRPHRKSWPNNTAIEFLRQTIRARPGEITLLSIGPLTNVALLFGIDPEIPSLLKDWVAMAGVFFAPEIYAEWNCHVDPIATQIAYSRKVARQVSIGLDVTMKCQMKAREVRQRFAVTPLNVVLEMAEVWFGKHEDAQITFHDPLAAATIFRPEICTYQDGKLDITIEGEKKAWGRTIFTPAAGGPHRVADKVDAAAFFEEYFSVFG